MLNGTRVFALAVAAVVGSMAASSARASDPQLDPLIDDICSFPSADPVQLYDDNGVLLWSGTAGDACTYLTTNYAVLAPLAGDADAACTTRAVPSPGKGEKCTGTTCKKGGTSGECKSAQASHLLSDYEDWSCNCILPSDLFSSSWLSVGTLLVGALVIGGSRFRMRDQTGTV